MVGVVKGSHLGNDETNDKVSHMAGSGVAAVGINSMPRHPGRLGVCGHRGQTRLSLPVVMFPSASRLTI